MRLLVHIAGEADLLLPSAGKLDDHVRAARISDRRRQLTTALASSEGSVAAHDLLRKSTWDDDHPRTPAPSPLLGALATLSAAPDLDVVIVGTCQEPSDPLDTMPIAQDLADALRPGPAGDIPIRSTATVAVSGLAEQPVVDALTHHLAAAPHYEEALVTWGSGATTLAMGGLTALSQAGIPWRLILTSDPEACKTVDPLGQLDTDPVVGVLVRWRMFAALDELASQEPPMVTLTGAQHDLIRRAANRHRAGFAARDCASLRAVVADAVVRRDGTASLAVRRYITSRYEELLATDQVTHPGAVDLLWKYERSKGGPSLGVKLGKIREDRERNAPDVVAAVDLPSYKWLLGREADSLRKIGNGSHTLSQPDLEHSRTVGAYLSQYATDGHGWQDAGLPEPPVTPADTVLAVWLAGDKPDHPAGTIGTQLTEHGPPAMVQEHAGVAQTRIRAVIFGVPGQEGSLTYAEADAERMRAAGHEAWAEPIELTGADPAAVEQAIASRLTRDVASLLLVPTGYKAGIPPLLDAMRPLGARYGVPLFVRQTAKPATPGSYDVHLWPALTGGDRPLLIAAQRALRALELDVAWRLLAASAIDRAVTDNARRLADAFASRKPEQDAHWPQPDPAPAPDLRSRTIGMINQRLALVNTALADSKGPDAVRLLVLAADVMEASIAAMQLGGYKKYRKQWCDIARQRDTPQARPAQILLLLNKARDRAPITHGAQPHPDAVVADAANRLIEKLDVTSTDALPTDVPSLLRNAVVAAGELGLGQPDLVNGLVRRHEQIAEQIIQALSSDRRATPFA